LIFTGNEFCKATNSAKVRLLFENVKDSPNSANCPLDCNTLEIEKIIDNSGKVEYYLNKESSRLKDIVETLASLQLGVKGFSIINQGSIENILRVSPEERAIMLEEILGLRQLEIKKESSERKLNASLINLDKVRSLENEILPHYRSLKKNVTRFEKLKELKSSLEIDEKDYYSYKYKEITKDDILLKEKLKNAESKLSDIEKGIKLEEEKLGFQTSSEKDDKANKFSYLREEINNKIRIKNEEKNKIIYELAKTEGNLDYSLKKLEDLPKKMESDLHLADFSSITMSVGNIRILIKEICDCFDLSEIKNKLQGIEREIDRIIIKKEGNKLDLNLKEEVDNLKEKVVSYKQQIELVEKELNEFYLQLEEMKKDEEEHNRNIKNAFSLLEQQQHEKMIALNELKVVELSEEKIKLNLENLRNTVTSSNII
jgi:chromosome segregation protein